MSYDDKGFMSRGFRVRHKYTRGRGPNICERCHVKRRRTSSGWEYFDPQTQPQPVDGSKAKPYWTASNPPCVKRDEQPEPSDDKRIPMRIETIADKPVDSKPDAFDSETFRAEKFTVELNLSDVFLLGFFMQFTGCTADRVYHGIVDPGVPVDFWSKWSRLSELITKLHNAHEVKYPKKVFTSAEKKRFAAKIRKALAKAAP